MYISGFADHPNLETFIHSIMSEYAGDSVSDAPDLLKIRLTNGLTEFFMHGLEECAEATPGKLIHVLTLLLLNIMLHDMIFV